MHTITDKKLLMLRPEEIRINYDDSKNHTDFELKYLSCSIATIGLLEPILVRRDTDGNYILISGIRRLKAAIMAGLRRIPCILHKIDSHTAKLYSVAENLHQKNISFFTEAEEISNLVTNLGFTHSHICAALGISHTDLILKLNLLKIDCILREQITNANLSEEYVKALLQLPSIMRDKALDDFITQDMTSKQAKDYVNQLLNAEEPSKPKGKPIRKGAIGDVRLFSNSLLKLITTIQNSGIDANLRKYETDRFIEFKIKIIKEQPTETQGEQLKIC